MSSVEILLRAAFAWLIYPGWLFLIVLGSFFEGLRRQFAIRAEGREVPSLFQPFGEFRQLLKRTSAVPAGTLPAKDDEIGQRLASTRQESNRLALYAIPLLGLLALSSGIVLLPLPGNLWPFLGTEGPLGADLLGVSLLFLAPACAAILLGSFSGSVYAQLAGSRAFQLLVVCALPYAVALYGPALVKGVFDLQAVTDDNSWAMVSAKILCGLLFLVCLPVVLRLRPLAHGGGETLEGVMTDLSGPPLALVRLMEAAERIAFPVLFASLFVPFGATNPLIFILGSLLGLGVVGAIETLLNQVRLREGLNFYLRFANPAALILLVLVAFGIKS